MTLTHVPNSVDSFTKTGEQDTHLTASPTTPLPHNHHIQRLRNPPIPPRDPHRRPQQLKHPLPLPPRLLNSLRNPRAGMETRPPRLRNRRLRLLVPGVRFCYLEGVAFRTAGGAGVRRQDDAAVGEVAAAGDVFVEEVGALG